MLQQLARMITADTDPGHIECSQELDAEHSGQHQDDAQGLSPCEGMWVQPHVPEMINDNRSDELPGDHRGEITGIPHLGNQHDRGRDKKRTERAAQIGPPRCCGHPGGSRRGNPSQQRDHTHRQGANQKVQ